LAIFVLDRARELEQRESTGNVSPTHAEACFKGADIFCLQTEFFERSKELGEQE
jgi:hypothetical protein